MWAPPNGEAWRPSLRIREENNKLICTWVLKSTVWKHQNAQHWSEKLLLSCSFHTNTSKSLLVTCWKSHGQWVVRFWDRSPTFDLWPKKSSPQKNQGKPSTMSSIKKRQATKSHHESYPIPLQLLQNEVTPTCGRTPALPEVCFKDNTSWTHKSIFSDSRSSCISSCWTKNRSSTGGSTGVSSVGGTSWGSGKAAPPKHLKTP